MHPHRNFLPTEPRELFTYFKKLLEEYSNHSFMAKWQHDQLDKLMENLPVGNVVCVHDYSEGYSRRQQDKLQSEYFVDAKVSLHVTILYRNAVDGDGKKSTEDEPHIAKEQVCNLRWWDKRPWFCPNSTSNHWQLLETRGSYQVFQMHEVTDGCIAQYKSRHCVWNLWYSANMAFIIFTSFELTEQATCGRWFWDVYQFSPYKIHRNTSREKFMVRRKLMLLIYEYLMTQQICFFLKNALIL